MVDVVTKEEFNAAITALKTQLEVLEAEVTAIPQPVAMPQDVKDALIKVLEWMKANV